MAKLMSVRLMLRSQECTRKFSKPISPMTQWVATHPELRFAQEGADVCRGLSTLARRAAGMKGVPHGNRIRETLAQLAEFFQFFFLFIYFILCTEEHTRSVAHSCRHRPLLTLVSKRAKHLFIIFAISVASKKSATPTAVITSRDRVGGQGIVVFIYSFT